jgi:hypothetical protein
VTYVTFLPKNAQFPVKNSSNMQIIAENGGFRRTGLDSTRLTVLDYVQE